MIVYRKNSITVETYIKGVSLVINNCIFNDKWIKLKYNKEIDLDNKQSKETEEF